MDRSAILLIHCRDQPGLVASISNFIADNGGNILDLDQHVDDERGVFFMRVEWDLAGFRIPLPQMSERFGDAIGTPFTCSGNYTSPMNACAWQSLSHACPTASPISLRAGSPASGRWIFR